MKITIVVTSGDLTAAKDDCRKKQTKVAMNTNKRLILVSVLALLLSACNGEYHEYERLRARGVTWNLNGYKVIADEREYLCGWYEVVNNEATGGNGTLLGVGGSAQSVSLQAPVFRIQLFSCRETMQWPDKKLLGEVTCSSFRTEAVIVRSKSKYEYEP